MKQSKCEAANAVLFDNGAILPEALCQTKSAHPPGTRGGNTVLRGYLTAINKAISKNNNVMPCNPARANMSWWLWC